MFSDGMAGMMDALEDWGQAVYQRGAEAISAGADVAVEYMQAEVPVDTGGLQASIRKYDLKTDARGDRYRDVYPDGFNPQGERYATIGSVIEYGRSNTPPNPFMARSIKKGNGPVVAAMMEKLRGE